MQQSLHNMFQNFQHDSQGASRVILDCDKAQSGQHPIHFLNSMVTI